METYIVISAAAVGILSTPVCAFFLLFRCFPHHLIRMVLRFREFLAGMKIKYVGDENLVFCYGERNAPRPDKTTIVFIHGFSSSKDQWIPHFKGLPKDLHLIALDLPGHGASSVPPVDLQLDLNYVLEVVKKFLDLVGLADKKIHLVGASLGGTIVGLFAAQYPERVEKLTMVCPAMHTPVESDFSIQVREAIDGGIENLTTDKCKLLPTDIPGMKAMLDECCYNKNIIKLNDQIWKGLLQLRLAKTDFYLKLFKAITATDNLDVLLRTAPGIKVPTQLIWGQQDMLIHISGAELLKSKLPDCQRMDVIDRCGHAIEIDRPGAFNKYLLLFIQSDMASQVEEKKYR